MHLTAHAGRERCGLGSRERVLWQTGGGRQERDRLVEAQASACALVGSRVPREWLLTTTTVKRRRLKP